MKRRAILFAGGALAAIGTAAAIKPTRRAAEIYVPIELEQQLPKQFADWKIDTSIVPILPDPGVQANLDKLYTQTLARTYINSQGKRVMLSIAYGADQGSDATQAHRPEFCYTAQGFTVRPIGQTRLSFGGQEIVASRLIGRMGARFEPITYWMTLNDKVVLPGLSRKLAQIRIGLGGLIPDGMLVRVSTVGLSEAESFTAQADFLSSLYASMPEQARERYFGRA